MAYLESSTRIKSGSGSIYQRSIYHFLTTSGTPNYIHFKTNIPASSNWMFYIEAEGYNYGRGEPVLCSWVGYPYSGTGTTINVQLLNHYTGMSADGVYQSSDSYVCLRAYASSHYYNGFILNAIQSAPNGAGAEISISASSQNSTSGNYY